MLHYPSAAFAEQTAEAATGAASIIVNDAGSVKGLHVWRPVAPTGFKSFYNNTPLSALLSEPQMSGQLCTCVIQPVTHTAIEQFIATQIYIVLLEDEGWWHNQVVAKCKALVCCKCH